MPADLPASAEWLEADGRGGFASGPAHGARTRRYHALLLTGTPPPGDRMVLVAGLEAWVEHAGERIVLTAQRYAPDVVTQGAQARFSPDPWPCWRYTLPDGTTLTQELLVDPDGCDTVLRWRGLPHGAALHVRPFLAVRPYHALQHENPDCDFSPLVAGGNVAWCPYKGQPAIAALTNALYRHDPCWYRNFLYTEEQRRGLDCVEDLAAPGVFTWSGNGADAFMILRAGDGLSVRAAPLGARVLAGEAARRAALPDSLARAARAYLIERPADGGQGLIAGYPWFGEWGRDTFIALRGLLLGTGRVDEAQAVLLAWAGLVSEGMLPNRLADGGAPEYNSPEYNSVDASLWYIVAVQDVCAQASLPDAVRTRLQDACEAILAGYANGTRHGIGPDSDDLLRAGQAGLQLTWMDAKVDDWVVTPRIGKPVEIQALWHAALRIGGTWNARWTGLADRVATSFRARFPNPAGGLFDVVDADHLPGTIDASIRPNQIFAVGGLPYPLLKGSQARAVVDLCEARLLTPMGLRTLSPDDSAYRPHYRGTPRARDGAYHQGTVWPWLIGPFTEAWLRTRGDTPAARTEARARFVQPLLDRMDEYGIGHVCEVADGDAPHAPGGCPFQAWSLGELIRARAMTAPA